jgi:hypothetical protein
MCLVFWKHRLYTNYVMWGASTAFCSIPACISLGVANSPSTMPWNSLFQRKELTILIILTKKLTYKPSQGAKWYQRLSQYPKIPQPDRLLLKFKIT